jgi:hypothetical protein
MIVLKYYANELNDSIALANHSDDYFTRHMRCKLYNQKNVHVGTLITQNHHYKENNMHFVSATSTIRIFKVGKFMYHLIFESKNGYLSRMVKTIPHYADGQFADKKLEVHVGPRRGTSNNLSNERFLIVNVFN